MQLDMIIVLSLALLFFGGVSFLVIREREREKSKTASIPIKSKESSQSGPKNKTEQ
jgi:hypothetical protein